MSDRETEIRSGLAAGRLLQDETFLEQCATLRAKYLEAFETSLPEERDVREHAYAALTALNGITNELKSRVTAGTLAKRAIERADSGR